ENEYTEELLPKKRVNTVNDENSISKVESRHCSNCYGTEHYANTCKFPTVNGENSTSKVEGHHCGNCFGTGHYANTCKFPKDHF
ncbi:18054_t:CDS:1, partial [Racocetra fulgida]